MSITKKSDKRNYTKPLISRTKLDTDISLIMLSDPPADPDGAVNPDHFSLNPFKFNNLK